MNIHAFPWSPLDRGPMTAASDDVCVTDLSNANPCNSNSCGQDWESVVKSLPQEGSKYPASTSLRKNNMCSEFDCVGENSIPLEFMYDLDDMAPVPTTADNSLLSSICDPNAVLQPSWPTVSHGAPVEYNHAPFFNPGLVPWEEPYQHQMVFDTHGYDSPAMMPTISNPIGVPSTAQFDLPFMEYDTPSVSTNEGSKPEGDYTVNQNAQNVSVQDDLFGIEDEGDGGDTADPCYAQLLYQCLKAAPNYTLSLRELYEWVAQHSQKAKDPKNRGWQNSVRHNLSMNAAFARVPHHAISGPKKGSLWKLTEEALQQGVISTTRYRKEPKRRAERRTVPAVNRQTSGAKGGRATRDATRFRQQRQRGFNGVPSSSGAHRSDYQGYGASHSPYSIRSTETSPQPPVFLPPTPSISPYFIDDASRKPLSLSVPQTPSCIPQDRSTPPSHLQFSYQENQPKLNPFATSFEFMPIEFSQGGLFGNHDSETQHLHSSHTPTPSLMTETSSNENLLSATTMMPPTDNPLHCRSGTFSQ